MSLVTYPNSNKPNASGCASKKNATTPAVHRPSPAACARCVQPLDVFVLNVFDAIAEARAQKAMIEAELYLNRYRHTSKNDDDLPVIR